jgi:Ca2+-binding EF-hand superfamily protein
MGQAPTAAEVQQMMVEVDDDKNGAIDFDEFVQLMGKSLGDSQDYAKSEAVALATLQASRGRHCPSAECR